MICTVLCAVRQFLIQPSFLLLNHVCVCAHVTCTIIHRGAVMFCPFSVAVVGLAAAAVAAAGILPLYWFIYKYRFYKSNYKCYFRSLFKTNLWVL